MPKKRYGGNRYWEKERPLEAAGKWVALRYFPAAGKLQVQALWYRNGETQKGKVVTIDQEDFCLHPELGELLRRVLSEWS